MAETRDSKQQQDQPRGIAAAAIEGATEGERSATNANANPDDPGAKLATPAPGMTKQPAAGPSSTNQYSGITGAIRDDQDAAANDDDGDRRRAAGGGNPDAADESIER